MNSTQLEYCSFYMGKHMGFGFWPVSGVMEQDIHGFSIYSKHAVNMQVNNALSNVWNPNTYIGRLPLTCPIQQRGLLG